MLVVAPIVAILLAYSPELLDIWIGADFARQSAQVAQLLAVGVFINVLAQVPFAALQGIGRADIPAKLQLIQLPFYALGIVYLVDRMGIVGVAIAWMLRAFIDMGLLSLAADKLLPIAERKISALPFTKVAFVFAAILSFWIAGSALSGEPLTKIAISFVMFSLLVVWLWFYVLSKSDRENIVGALNRGVAPYWNPR
jgi:O-antigen/teichoic acid export membrane protein